MSWHSSDNTMPFSCGRRRNGVASAAKRSFRCRSAGEPASNDALRELKTSHRRSRRLQGRVRQRPLRHPSRHRPTSPSTTTTGETVTTSRTRTLGSRAHLESLIPPRTLHHHSNQRRLPWTQSTWRRVGDAADLAHHDSFRPGPIVPSALNTEPGRPGRHFSMTRPRR